HRVCRSAPYRLLILFSVQQVALQRGSRLCYLREKDRVLISSALSRRVLSQEASDMSIFDMHRAVVEDYRHYVQSFISIADPEIRAFVEKELADGRRLWPEPLVQLNPEYQKAGTVDDLVSSGLLLAPTALIFRNDSGEPYRLFQHQHDAIVKASHKQSYVVTSGTGSGK